MGVPTSEVGYTIATTRRETTKVHENMWWHWRKKKSRTRDHDRHSVFNNFSPENCAVYEIMWENMVQQDGPQETI